MQHSEEKSADSIDVASAKVTDMSEYSSAPTCWHCQWARNERDSHSAHRIHDGISMRTGIFPYTRHCIPLSHDTGEDSYFNMCVNSIHAALAEMRDAMEKGREVSIFCITTSLSYKDKRNPASGLEHLHSWISYESPEDVEDALRRRVPRVSPFVQEFDAHPSTACSGPNIGIGRPVHTDGVGTIGKTRTVSRQPWKDDKTTSVNGRDLTVMLSNTESYSSQFRTCFTELTGSEYRHGTDLCYTFLSFTDNVPTSFVMSVPAAAAKKSDQESWHRQERDRDWRPRRDNSQAAGHHARGGGWNRERRFRPDRYEDRREERMSRFDRDESSREVRRERSRSPSKSSSEWETVGKGRKGRSRHDARF